MLKLWLAMLLMVIGLGALVGCEADADVDDDGASFKVDVDD